VEKLPDNDAPVGRILLTKSQFYSVKEGNSEKEQAALPYGLEKGARRNCVVLDILSKDSPVSDKSIRSRDSLTGLYSRTYFEQQLIALDKEECVPLSVIIADVNGLRLLNNACGLQEGDELLQRISTALVRTSRKKTSSHGGAATSSPFYAPDAVRATYKKWPCASIEPAQQP